MPRSHSAFPRCPEPCLLFGCVRDPLARRKIEAAMRDDCACQWFDDFSALLAARATETRSLMLVVVDVIDRAGTLASSVARTLTTECPGVGIVVYRKPVAGSESETMLLG